MEVFSVRARAAIEISVDGFGTDADKIVYYEWARENPQVRKSQDEPADDGKGIMPVILRETIIECLHRRHDHLRHQSRSPSITAVDMAEIAIRMSHLYSIARWLHPGRLEWPTSI